MNSGSLPMVKNGEMTMTVNWWLTIALVIFGDDVHSSLFITVRIVMVETLD